MIDSEYNAVSGFCVHVVSVPLRPFFYYLPKPALTLNLKGRVSLTLRYLLPKFFITRDGGGITVSVQLRPTATAV